MNEIFTLATFVTMSIALLFAGLAIFAIMYWIRENDHKPDELKRKYSREYLRLHRL